MNSLEQKLSWIDSLKHSPIRNYAGIPGLTSWLVYQGSCHDRGIVRLLECSRAHQESIVPHSHRFDFSCEVLRGAVRNIVWSRDNLAEFAGGADEYQQTALIYMGEPGQYATEPGEVGMWKNTATDYKAGDTYRMAAEEVHSIFFDRDTLVLFFEGPKVSDSSIILEPFVDGEVVHTFKVEPWAFKGAEVAA